MKYRVSRALAGPLLHLLWRPEVTGGEHIPAAGGAIIASNHLSIVDSIFLPLMFERPITFAAKSEYFTGKGLGQRFAGAYMRATRQLSVDRVGARAAQDTLEAALRLLQAGELFGIYPEGTRSPDGKLYRGRTGIGWLVLASQVPVIPVAMIGTERVLPPGRSIPALHRVGIRVGEPLTFGKYSGARPAQARRAITDEVMKAIQALSGQEYVPVYASVRKDELAREAAEAAAKAKASSRPAGGSMRAPAGGGNGHEPADGSTREPGGDRPGKAADGGEREPTEDSVG